MFISVIFYDRDQGGRSFLIQKVSSDPCIFNGWLQVTSGECHFHAVTDGVAPIMYSKSKTALYWGKLNQIRSVSR